MARPFSFSDSGDGFSLVDDVNGGDVSEKRRKAPCAPGTVEENSFEEMTMNEIMNGKGEYFPGLIPLVFAYLDHIQCDQVTMKRLTTYLDFIEKRSKGELLTPATWMRSFVQSHPAYQKDSFVTDEIAYDLLQTCRDIGTGEKHVPELLGDVHIEPIRAEGAYQVKLDSRRAQNEHIQELLRRYTSRKAFSSTASIESNTI